MLCTYQPQPLAPKPQTLQLKVWARSPETRKGSFRHLAFPLRLMPTTSEPRSLSPAFLVLGCGPTTILTHEVGYRV